MINSRWNLGLIVGVLFFLAPAVHAKEQKIPEKPTYSAVKSSDCGLDISLPTSLSDRVHVSVISTVNEGILNNFSELTLVSPICQFDIDDDALYDSSVPIHILAHYSDDRGYRPRLYFWNGKQEKWTALPGTMNRISKTVETDIHLAYARIGVFVEENAMHEGVASWYADKRFPEGAATDLYPVGTRLKVTNTLNDTSTVVVTTSTWVNPNKKRVIDLVKNSFLKIAKLEDGLANVRIEKLF